MVSILPLLYQFTYWGSFLKKFKIDDLYSQIFHFWIFIELPLIILAIISFYNPLFEIFLYNMMFYFLLLYNVFVIGKIFRKKHSFTFKLWTAFAILVFIVTWWFILGFNPSLTYLYILIALCANFIYFIPAAILKTSHKLISNDQEDHSEK